MTCRVSNERTRCDKIISGGTPKHTHREDCAGPPAEGTFLYFPRVYMYASLIHFCVSTFLHFCISAFLHFCISAFLHFCIAAFPHFNIPALRGIVHPGLEQVTGWDDSGRVKGAVDTALALRK